MKRTINKHLIEWKENKKRKPLILTGVRQCGKTYTLKKFGDENYENVCYINFESDKKFHDIFDYDFDTKRILSEIELLAGIKITPDNTLLIFDEIQECPKALTSLKYFAEDAPKIHIATAGSLLGVALNNKNISFPVGKVNRMQMFPLSFKEFIDAIGEGKYLELFVQWDCNRPISEAHTRTMETLLYSYYTVGGMPEVVSEYAEHKDLKAVSKIQDEILADYADDFSKHAPIKDIEKLRLIWNSVPKQLARENNKFMFSHVQKGKRAHELESSLQWLRNAGLIYVLELVQNAEMPLSIYANVTNFKVYLSDTGLLSRMLGLSLKSFISKNNGLKTSKGAIAENYVLNELVRQNITPYYWKSNNTAELDFIFEYDDKVIPLEVKAAANTQAKSYRLFCEKYNIELGVKTSLKNIGCGNTGNTGNTKTLNLPLYLLWNLKYYLEN